MVHFITGNFKRWQSIKINKGATWEDSSTPGALNVEVFPAHATEGITYSTYLGTPQDRRNSWRTWLERMSELACTHWALDLHKKQKINGWRSTLDLNIHTPAFPETLHICHRSDCIHARIFMYPLIYITIYVQGSRWFVRLVAVGVWDQSLFKSWPYNNQKQPVLPLNLLSHLFMRRCS